jgi:hypothetical protein
MEQNAHEAVYQKLKELLDLIKQTYKSSRYNLAHNDIYKTMKRIYKNPKTFEYVFERVYSNGRNPFTTAYHEFMNYKNSGYDDDDIFYSVSEGILIRLIKEKDEFTTF